MTGTVATTQWADFRERCAQVAGQPLDDAGLHQFSVTRPEEFWRSLWVWADLVHEGSPARVLTAGDVETARFFPDVRLNHAENLLRQVPGREDQDAVISVHVGRPTERCTRRELRARVRSTATALAALGVDERSAVVVMAANDLTAVVTSLAVTALGATLSTTTADVGTGALLARLAQVEPVVLLVDRRGMAAGADGSDAALGVLLAGLPSVAHVVLLDDGPLPDLAVPTVDLRTAVDRASASDGADRPWPRLPFDHPLFAMFSSGTTGPPKAIVHGIGGTLLEHVKEHRLHGDLRATDVLYFHTTTAWMMWNWQLSALAIGATIVLFDGAVTGPGTLWDVVAEHRVTVFGTSPAYLQLCQDADHRPTAGRALPGLRAVLSTGAVLHAWQYDWLRDQLGDVPLQSISGGTDVIGCFVLGHPERPVVPGWCQTRSLGLDVTAVDDDGSEVVGRVGELVCRSPFPSRPVRFLHDPDGARLHEAYFAQHPGMWTHGDLIEFAPDGRARLHGRSDGVLNIDGIRIGPAEVHAALHSVPEVAEAMAVEQRVPGEPGRSRMVLLVTLRPGGRLDAELDRRIRTTLRREASAAHVPSLLVAVPRLPLTHNGKRSERAARDAVNGDPVANAESLADPRVPEEIRAAVRQTEAPGDEGTQPDPDGLAAMVARIWTGVLGVRSAESADDFFDLGGSSRQSISLLRRVRSELGHDLPIEVFLADPTLGGLTRALARGAGAGERPDVVVLAEGDPAAPPLVLFHDAWGDVTGYRTLAGAMSTRSTVLGVRAELVSADGRVLPFAEVVAADVQRLRAAVPAGPYRLAGFSFGGLVAYEVARTLSAAGEQVEFLGLVDVRAPLASLDARHARLRRLAERAAFLLPGFSENTLRQFLRDHLAPSEQPEERRVLFRSGRLYDEHVWGPYVGPVSYFRAARRIPVLTNQLYAWRRAAPHLTVVRVPGAHHTLLDQQNAPALAAAVSAALPD